MWRVVALWGGVGVVGCLGIIGWKRPSAASRVCLGVRVPDVSRVLGLFILYLLCLVPLRALRCVCLFGLRRTLRAHTHTSGLRAPAPAPPPVACGLCVGCRWHTTCTCITPGAWRAARAAGAPGAWRLGPGPGAWELVRLVTG